MPATTPEAITLYPERSAPRAMTAEDLWKIPRVGGPEVSKDGRQIAVTVTTYDLETNEGRGRIWLLPSSGGEPRALTSADVSSGSPAFSPDGRQIAFTRKDAKGKAQLHVMPMDGGEPVRRTDMPLGVFDPRWLPDGAGIVFGAMLIRGHLSPEATAREIERRDKDPVKAYATEDRVFRFWDTWLVTGEVPHLFVLDLASGAIRDLMPESTSWFEWMDPNGQYDISPDGAEIAYGALFFDERRSVLREAIFVAPVSGGGPVCLTADHPAIDARPRYTPDGSAIVYGMSHDPYYYADRMRLMRYDRATKAHVEVLGDWDRSPSSWAFAADGALILEAEDEARTAYYRWPMKHAPKRIMRGGFATGLRVVGDRMFFTLQSLVATPELWSCGTDGASLRQLTHFTDQTAKPFATGEVREMQFTGAGGETVQMFIVLPPGHREGTRYPLVQVIHGGPHGTSPDAFHFRWNAQMFASPGYVVALVNFQGSTGWGQDFAKRIQGAWGDLPYDDVMKATDVLIATGYADEKRMAAAGGSYGGYMASWIEGHTDRFKCIVNHAGVYNTLSMYASDVTQGRAQSLGGEAWDGLERIDRWNPARQAKGFKTPMLVIHGEKDYRVPVTQGLECYGVLKAKGVPARLVYFPDENHWILKPRNSMYWYDEVMGWLRRHLGG